MNRMTTNSKGELLLTPDGPLVYYAAHKQRIAAYEAEFERLKAVTNEQAQCDMVEELHKEIERQAVLIGDLQLAINQIYGIAQDFENV